MPLAAKGQRGAGGGRCGFAPADAPPYPRPSPPPCSFLRNTINSGEAATMTQKLLCACGSWGEAPEEPRSCAFCQP